MGAQVFKNLTQQEGLNVIMSVRTFLERYDAMVAGQGTYGAEGAAAKTVLAARGLTDEQIAKARALITELGTLSEAEDEPVDPEAFKKSEAALWGWYMEWSQVARAAVKQKALLRAMGFGSRSSGGTEEDGEEDGGGTPVVEPITPQPVVVPVA